MKDPEVLGNWLATRTKYATNGGTSERLRHVSRVDAVCWFLTLRVDYTAHTRDIKKFATAFRTTGTTACCSLLNSCYGGVALDFSGEIGQRDYCPKNYGRLAPLFRPYKYNYAPTVSGMQRAARVQALLDSLA